MLNRCTRPEARGYADYGGRGINVCDRWCQFENFLADMGECPDGKSLERRNNNENYKPSNCKWASAIEQANNKRRTVFVTYGGTKISVATLAARFGLSPNVVYERIVKHGWSVQDAIHTPVIHRTANLTFAYKGKTYKLSELSKLAIVSRRTLYARLTGPKKWNVADAVETPVASSKRRS